MGMIRVSDDAEKKIKAMANGRTISATVDSLVAGEAANVDIQKWMEENFNSIHEELAKLKSLIEDTTVDRVDSGGPRKSSYQSNVKVYVPWDAARELFFEFLPDDAPEYIGSASEAIHQADSEFPVYIQDDKLWTEDYYGTKSPILNISPRVKQFLESHN